MPTVKTEKDKEISRLRAIINKIQNDRNQAPVDNSYWMKLAIAYQGALSKISRFCAAHLQDNHCSEYDRMIYRSIINTLQDAGIRVPEHFGRQARDE